MDGQLAAERMITQAFMGRPLRGNRADVPSSSAEGFPNDSPICTSGLIEFNAHWLVSLVGGMDKAWVTGTGQDADWWLGHWDDRRPATPTTSRLWPGSSA